MRPFPPAHFQLRRARGLRTILLFAVVIAGLTPATALGTPATRVVRYHGDRLVVPAAWPVYHLQADRRQCVRFNRHAVYLGDPGGNQRCPATAAGRTEAILASPLRARAGRLLPPTTAAGANRGPASEAQIINTAHGVIVTATWNRDPAVIERALGLRSMSAAVAAAGRHRPSSEVAFAQARSRAFAGHRATATVSTPGEVYTGPGFDACSTPSASQMSAWGASSYRAIGVYIGGANMACSQPNLSATWVSQQGAAGWHLIPIYVGLQAPSNSCGCASISTSAASAGSQGTAAAQDAVTDAQAIGLGSGNPLYLDMESYNRTSTNTASVLAFISAWTQQLHAGGYKSGVYSSSDSGVHDLVAQYGSGYAEPDDIWIANWNNQQSTTDANVPSADWATHQRLHQYQGAHNETYGGVQINIDGDYLDAATAAAGTGPGTYAAPTPAPAPTLSVAAGPDGSVELTPSWRYATGVSSWQIVAGANPTALSWTGPTIGAGARLPYVTRNAFPYFAVQALGSAGQVLGTSTPQAMPAHLTIYGQSVFVPRRGLGGVPVSCFGVTPCQLTTTISSGRTKLSSTGAERVSGSGGLAYFTLTPAAATMLARAKHHQLPVTIRVHDGTGHSATRTLNLTSFATADPNPRRRLRQAPALRFVGATEFVSHGWLGGVLAGCFAGATCQASSKVVVAGKVVARSKPQLLGAGELGYLFFSLSPAGHKLLVHARGNQLPATITITTTTPTGTATATAQVALVSY